MRRGVHINDKNPDDFKIFYLEGSVLHRGSSAAQTEKELGSSARQVLPDIADPTR